MKLSRSTVVVLAGLAFVGGLGVYFSIPENSPSIVAPQAQKAPFQERVQEAVALWQPQSSRSGNYQASDVLATLQKDERAIITLPSGNQYSLRLDQRSSDKGVEQLRATVDPDGLPGFALFTLGEERMFGTLNTPEGVYELVGTQASFTLSRALEIDAARRLGEDYKIKDSSAEALVAQEKKQMPIDLGPKQ
ncbi:MAG: hypothetical protein ACPF9H_04805 [Aequoribacter sp.]|uniref:hypothetical protein n=1 Tax=Aequoribacter sp. TaxID=2847771 RepID=UPI003C633F65